MRRISSVLLFGIALALLAAPVGSVLGEDLPPGPVQRMRTTYAAAEAPAQFELVQLILDFAPGSFTPPHVHGGLGYVTVLEGELVHQIGGMEHAYRAGEGWVEPTEVHAAGNRSQTNARALVSFLLPYGTPLTMLHTGETAQLPPGPTLAGQFRTRMDNPPPSPFDVVHLLLDFPTGAFTPTHLHGGPGVVTVLEGQMARRLMGVEYTFQAGETWEEPEGFHAAGNRRQGKASVAVTFLLPRGGSLTALEPKARDGQSLSAQSTGIQAMFMAAWGHLASGRWVEEHEAELGRGGAR